jgi:hypothetical protein
MLGAQLPAFDVGAIAFDADVMTAAGLLLCFSYQRSTREADRITER